MYPGFTQEAIKFPTVAVHCGESDQVGGGIGVFAKPREFSVEVSIITEASDVLDDNGVTTTTARERNAAVRGEVLSALAVSDSADTPAGLAGLCDTQDLPRGLAAELTAVLIPGIWIMQAIVRGMSRSIMESPRKAFVSTISVWCIAQPVAIDGEPS